MKRRSVVKSIFLRNEHKFYKHRKTYPVIRNEKKKIRRVSVVKIYSINFGKLKTLCCCARYTDCLPLFFIKWTYQECIVCIRNLPRADLTVARKFEYNFTLLQNVILYRYNNTTYKYICHRKVFHL